MRRAEDCSGALLGWRRRRGECDRLTTGQWTPRSEQLFRQITANLDERTHHALKTFSSTSPGLRSHINAATPSASPPVSAR